MDETERYQDYGFAAEFYDQVEPYKNRADVAFFVNTAVETGGPVLELGCGTGRVLIPIARAGVDIIGVDLSPSMLAICRKSLANEPEVVQARIQLVQADMRDFALKQQFPLIIIPFRPFQHLTTVADQIQCLRQIYQHLAETGQLILDLFNPSLPMLIADNLGQELGEEPEFVLPDGRKVLRRFKIVARDLFRQINQVEMIYYVHYPDGHSERLVHAFPMRYLFRYEAEHLLARCGFHLEQVYADYEKKPYGAIYPGELVMVARKATKSDIKPLSMAENKNQ